MSGEVEVEGGGRRRDGHHDNDHQESYYNDVSNITKHCQIVESGLKGQREVEICSVLNMGDSI